MPDISSLWKDPLLHPITLKARAIPALNPLNVHGRVFTLSWLGFFLAFWAWYGVTPLLTLTISKDIGLSSDDIANSNIIGLVATLLVRVVSGPACDKFGPRKTFATLLLIGSIPTALAGSVETSDELLALRFFLGILGGTFVPCQAWTTAFFDKSIIGVANALTAGLGNSGGGVTYFVMPALFDALVYHSGYKPTVAWRITFVVPFALLVIVALLMLFCCPDTPSGPWEDKLSNASSNMAIAYFGRGSGPIPAGYRRKGNIASISDAEIAHRAMNSPALGYPRSMLDIVEGEVIEDPSWKEIKGVFRCPPVYALCSAYFCSFGGELAINAILGSFLLKNIPNLTQSSSGSWAAMFGLLNVVFRPLGGIASDFLYKQSTATLGKKYLILVLAAGTGVFQLALGIADPKSLPVMMGLIAGLAFFMEAGNGAVFSMVPHIRPYQTGIVTGIVGAAGNLGGIVFAIVFRYLGVNYHVALIVMGALTIILNMVTYRKQTIPKLQIGGA
ncbi:MAG: hypothetical protein M1829_006619 [Trizodia sp. TS-e1964]|nr:MAG: hypothetical protein M1829_006619 [Trizodia sp. TS-e1964]